MKLAWALLIVGVAGLVALRVTYELTYEPAPSVRVRWRDGTSDWRRTVLEMQYGLAQPSGREGLSFSYILRDTTRDNIEALVTDPEVADTHDIDRNRFEVPFWTAHHSLSVAWIADRTPLLRWPPVRWSIIGALVAMTAGGVIMVARPLITGRSAAAGTTRSASSTRASSSRG